MTSVVVTASGRTPAKQTPMPPSPKLSREVSDPIYLWPTPICPYLRSVSACLLSFTFDLLCLLISLALIILIMPPKFENVNADGLADPTVQPVDAQLLEQATLGSLRKGQHLDANGNVISRSICLARLTYSFTNNITADPDLSNPTRPRLERPLDTIRSFEKAIDSGYKRRNSMMRGGASQRPPAFRY